MSRFPSFTLITVALVACGTGSAPAPTEPAVTLPIVVGGLASPESAAHDPLADVYLVSNIVGSPFDADHQGYISRIAPDGTVLAARWIDGLDAPKGVAAGGDLIAVADLAVLRRFDRKTGAAVDVITIPGATFLNGVEPDGDGGGFFVTDSGMTGVAEAPGMAPNGSDAILHVARDGRVTPVARGADLALPNGLALAGDTLYMVGFGGRSLVAFDRAGARTTAADLGAGFLDGLAVTPAGCVLVSSMEARAVLAGRPGGAFASAIPEVIAADLGLDQTRGRLLLPLLLDNQLRIVDVPPCE